MESGDGRRGAEGSARARGYARRRATAEAIEKRRLDCGAHAVPSPALRLTKTLRVVDLDLEKHDLKAVGPMPKVIARLDQYHAPSWAAPAPRVAENGTENGAQAVEIP
jgi:hypothetical protein